ASGTPYGYLWNSTPVCTDSVITGLSAGVVYRVTITDALGCTLIDFVNLTVPDPVISLVNTQNVLCYGNNNGAINVHVSGNTPPYTYQWSNNSTTQNVSGLYAGSYSVTIVNGNNCMEDTLIIVNQPQNLHIEIQTNDDTEYDFDNGSVLLTVTGGNAPYFYTWNNASTTQNLINIPAGYYEATVTDANQCEYIIGDTVYEICNFNVFMAVTYATCSQNDGTATVYALNGIEPYSYLWSNGGTNYFQSDLTSGYYSVTVTDHSGCSKQVFEIINDNEGPSIQTISIFDNSCNKGNNGAIEIDVSGGTEPYTIKWSNGLTTEHIDGLEEGSYDVVVRDNNGCLSMNNYYVHQPPEPVTNVTIVPPGCGQANGVASILATGGTPPYSFNWPAGETVASVQGLLAGNYLVTIIDANNCPAFYAEIFISDSSGASVYIDSIVSADCLENNGEAYISITGGSPPYIYEWSNGVTDENLTGIQSGVYTLAIRDNMNCLAVLAVGVPVKLPVPVVLCITTVDSITIRNIVCWENGESELIDAFKVYREGFIQGSYNNIAIISASEPNKYIDTIADPMIKAWRYKIAAIDVCNSESERSVAHRTIFLNMSVNSANNVSLEWNHYEGFSYEYYNIYRHTGSSAWELIDSVPVSQNSFTDQPSSFDDLNYCIVARKSVPCVVNDTAGDEYFGCSWSNPARKIINTGTNEKISVHWESILFPNPCNGHFSIIMKGENQYKNVRITVSDIREKQIISRQLHNEVQYKRMDFDMTGYTKGVYFVKIITPEVSEVYKIIIN
ncbi:MAG: T9SS type A sorting domain-containing protein, partial [Bacteroidota bacterium]